MKIISKLLILSVISLFVSCSDNLDLKPEDSLSDPTFWKTEQDLELYANRFYTSLPGALGPGADDQSDCYVNSKPNTYLFNTEVVPTSGGGWSSGDWGNIRACNYFMMRYHRVTGNTDNINRIVGTVRFFRAWEYFEKVKRFGDVPWYSTDLQTNSPELYKARDSWVLVMDSILADLDFAIKHLPTSKEVKAGRMHKYAAMAYKTRVCLFEASFRKYHGLGNYEELYKEAAKTAKALIDTEVYSIWNNEQPESDYYNLFIQEDLSNNSECIMPRVYVTELLMQNNTRQMEESYTGLSKAMVESYLCNDGLPIGVSPLYQGDNMPEKELADRDPRLKQTIDNPELAFKNLNDGTVQYRELPQIDPQYCTTGYYVMKYHSPDPAQWNIGLSTLDVFIFRYAEVLLSYAEAKAELGECTQDVLDESINELRDRVGMPHLTVNVGFTDPNWLDYGYTLTPLLHEIRRERAIELVGEGFRWNDIVRWKAGKLIENMKTVYGLRVTDELKNKYESFTRELTDDKLLIVYPNVTPRKWDDKLYLRPLPIEELAINTNLTQNPGWK
ncbi:MAG: RagB/SusD family nutrient uptake outer membrane protein [Dysgonomonas sp.]